MRRSLLPLLPTLLLAAGPTDRALLHPSAPAPDSTPRIRAFQQRQALRATSPLRAIPFRNVGPMGQGGRVVALAADPRKPEVWLAAFATGGLWITRNDGGSWEPLFDAEEAFALGDVAVVWGDPGVPRTLWVGTGEPNASRSSYAGAGVFRSDDGGKTWRNTGLRDSHRIAKVLVHPADPDTVYVAAQGPLYTEGGLRGIFKTTDGGKTWNGVLPGGPRTGAADLLMDWKDPQTLYAALWEKDRKPWDFLECGAGSGLHKSTDGGKTWTRLTSGLPSGTTVGRMGLAQSRQDARKLYVFVDNHALRGKDEKDPLQDPEALTAKTLTGMGREEFLKLDLKRVKAFLRENGFHKDLTAEKVREDLKAGKITVKDLLDYLGDADRDLFQTDIVGPELYATTDGGATWSRTHARRLDAVTYTYGYYFAQVRVDPGNDQRVYLLGMPLVVSDDGGKTFKGLNGEDWDTMHPDHHDLWIDPRNPNRLVLGNDGGLNVSMDKGATWRAVKNLPVGQCYTVAVDQADPYRIYTGLQDNGVMMGPARPLKPRQAKDGWRSIYGGDGAFVQVSPRDNATVYTESQFGHMSRLDLKGTGRASIRPLHQLKEPTFRFNWLTPILMSPHSPDILYAGTQFVVRSLDRGDTWAKVSGDLSSGKAPFVGGGGNVPFGTITTLAESPKRFGLLYAGTDEGRVWTSRDGGFSWKEAQGLPLNRWVVRVEASSHVEGRVYAAFNAYRNDTAEALLFRSDDYGVSWISIAGNLPAENLNTVREDPANPDLLYAGSDFGLFASLDGGKRWEVLGEGLPHVPVHDVAVQAKAKELVAATHGRSVFVAPVAALQLLTAELRAKPAHLFEVPKQKAQGWWKTDRPTWFTPREADPVPLWFHLKAGSKADLRIVGEKDAVLRRWSLDAKAGLNRVDWDLLVEPQALGGVPDGRRPFVRPGKYRLELEAAGQKLSQAMEVETPKERD
ncbi:MAG: glycosyl hydrolase [Acidobacteria bacterium]|nr:glycosyl hydrolase [Acidobacteriota bacterium]